MSAAAQPNPLPGGEQPARSSAAGLAALTQRYREIRRMTDQLREPLSEEDCIVQSMDDVSPTKWHLAHTTWFFETFVLEAAEPDFAPFHERFRVLYNSYYNGVGEQFPRPRRGLLSRPSLDEILSYRKNVDARMERLFDEQALDTDQLGLVELGLQHEQQHQELILMDIKHVLGSNPLRPAYDQLPEPKAAVVAPAGWLPHDEGPFEMGHEGDSFAFDNEGPRHRVWLASFELADRLVTNGEFLSFLESGGYEDPELWLSDGWATVREKGWSSPLYWEKVEGQWKQYTLGGLRRLHEDQAVCHVSYYEADAYARWAGARLPSEAEWERVAVGSAERGNFLERGLLHPAPVVDKGGRARQMLGDVWEWTRSAYAAYPGFTPDPGALGEYNGKFMVNQQVLRGGCCVTPRSHIRTSYRNFFPPYRNDILAGFRTCAR